MHHGESPNFQNLCIPVLGLQYSVLSPLFEFDSDYLGRLD